jgi:two-component system response regulator FixJ
MSHQRTVYVIDPDLSSRRSTTTQLARLGAEAWSFSNLAEFLDEADHLTPACILLAVPNEAGLGSLGQLMDRHAAWPVIVTSSRGDVRLAVQAMKLGALDFLDKPLEVDALANALTPACERLQDNMATSAAVRAAKEKLSRLTPRELDIVLGLLAGHANKGVAHNLGISARTVEMHRAHVMTKLGVRSLAEMAVIATQAGLLAIGRPASSVCRSNVHRLPVPMRLLVIGGPPVAAAAGAFPADEDQLRLRM